ncbi:glycosyltransferase family 2 protein [Ralstonia mannitolilytica]|uniref:glycosyltransferase family 2 protein n=1 Tax=Ralstonia mannitolilytica TaxID=105219 RepID=UPI002931BE7B|nr:glycosyltransferase family 2 protein [Ralstonia mannitolilytica]
MARVLIDVVIVNWNSGPQLDSCLRSIGEFGVGRVGDVIVVDNGSVDGSELAANRFDGVTLIRAGQNLGFGRACNLGAKQARNEMILFLNPDALIYEKTLSRCLDYVVDPEYQKVGIFGVQLIDEFGHVARSCDRFTHHYAYLLKSFGLNTIFPKLNYNMMDWDHKDTRFVDHVIGAFFLVRRVTFDQLNGFDERFFVYLEDLDFSYRAKKSGWLSVFLADVQAFHAGGGTSRNIKATRLFYSQRSRILYAFKHFSWWLAILVMFSTLFAELLSRSAFSLLKCSWSGLKETWVAYGMLFRWLPGWIFGKRTY